MPVQFGLPLWARPSSASRFACSAASFGFTAGAVGFFLLASGSRRAWSSLFGRSGGQTRYIVRRQGGLARRRDVRPSALRSASMRPVQRGGRLRLRRRRCGPSTGHSARQWRPPPSIGGLLRELSYSEMLISIACAFSMVWLRRSAVAGCQCAGAFAMAAISDWMPQCAGLFGLLLLALDTLVLGVDLLFVGLERAFDGLKAIGNGLAVESTRRP